MAAGASNVQSPKMTRPAVPGLRKPIKILGPAHEAHFEGAWGFEALGFSLRRLTGAVQHNNGEHRQARFWSCWLRRAIGEEALFQAWDHRHWVGAE
ncbi:MAG: hypothetical protein JWN98_1671 [Abditibacteriota bacterium]|nr:hypothetical protein [Abditibacteriota bacterium]